MTRIESAEIGSWVERAAFVRRLARALVRDEHDAEDLAQDACLAAHGRGPDAAVSWTAWIAGVLRNLALARRRAQANRESRERAAARPEAEPGDEGLLERLDVHQRVVAAVRALDEPYRTALLLRYFEELSPAQIAERTRTPVRTVHTRLSRGLGRLRAGLDRDSGGRGAWIGLLMPLIDRTSPGLLGALLLKLETKLAIGAAVAGGLFYAAWLAMRTPEPARASVSRADAADVSPPSERARSGSELAPVDPPEPPNDAEPRRPIAPAEPAGERLEVLVVDASDDAPVEGARVRWFDYEAYTRALADAQTTIDTPKGRELRFVDAREAWTDPNGWAKIELTGRRHALEASAGERWEFLFLNEVPADRRCTIRIETDRTVCVRVQDPAGRALSGVPVLLRRSSAFGATYEWKLTESEAPDGRAWFDHFQRRLRRGSGWHFAFGFPVLGDLQAPALERPCEDAPVLTLPGAGAIHVRVEGLDLGEDRADLTLALTVLDARSGAELSLGPDGPWLRPPLGADDVARVPWIGLGLRVRLELVRNEELLASTVVDGPARDREVVEASLRLSPQPFVTGRLVLSDGRPWPAARITVEPILFPPGKTHRVPRELAVDEGGRFRMPLREVLPKRGSRSYRFEGDHPGGLGKAVALVPLQVEVTGEGHELGDVVLDHGPLLASGRVVDESRSPVAGAILHLQARTQLAADAMWRHVEVSGASRTGADGRFELRLAQGELEPGSRLRISATAGPELAESTPLELVRGAADVEIVLARTGRVAGSLDRATGDASGVLLILRDGEHSLGFSASADGEFSASVLPGTYTFEVLRRGAGARFDPEERLSFAGVEVRAGETCRDPRLQGIDLGNGLPNLAITVVDRRGAPIRGATATPVGAPAPRVFVAGDDGVCRVRFANLPVDLSVGAFGYRERLLTGVAADARVVLDDGLAVRLSVGELPDGSTGYRLFAFVCRVDSGGLRRDLVYRDSFPTERRFFDSAGELRLRLPEPGAYEVSLSVNVLTAEHIGSGGPVETSAPLRFDVREQAAEQVFVLDVPPEAVRSAVERANVLGPPAGGR